MSNVGKERLSKRCRNLIASSINIRETIEISWKKQTVGGAKLGFKITLEEQKPYFVMIRTSQKILWRTLLAAWLTFYQLSSKSENIGGATPPRLPLTHPWWYAPLIYFDW